MWFAQLLRRGAEPLNQEAVDFLSALQAEVDDLRLDAASERFGDLVAASLTAGLIVEYGGVVGPVLIQVSMKGELALRRHRKRTAGQDVVGSVI